MNENNIIDKELEDDIFNLTVKENLFNQIEKEIEYIDDTVSSNSDIPKVFDKTFENKGLLDESYEKMPMILSEDDIYCNMSKSI